MVLSVIYLFWFFVVVVSFNLDFYSGFCFMPNPSVHSTHHNTKITHRDVIHASVRMFVCVLCWWSWIPVFIPPNHIFTSNAILSSTQRTNNSPFVYVLRDLTAHQIIQYKHIFVGMKYHFFYSHATFFSLPFLYLLIYILHMCCSSTEHNWPLKWNRFSRRRKKAKSTLALSEINFMITTFLPLFMLYCIFMYVIYCVEFSVCCWWKSHSVESMKCVYFCDILSKRKSYFFPFILHVCEEFFSEQFNKQTDEKHRIIFFTCSWIVFCFCFHPTNFDRIKFELKNVLFSLPFFISFASNLYMTYVVDLQWTDSWNIWRISYLHVKLSANSS